MNCPPGQIWSASAKRCVIPIGAFIGAVGKSKEPCPDGQVWNPNPKIRRCVAKDVFGKLYGAEKLRAASAEQKRLRGTAKKAASNATQGGPKKPVKVASPPKAAVAVASTPANKRNIELETKKPRANHMMPPGLTRDKMLEWIDKQCSNQEDPVTLEDYKDAELKDLRSIVKLGSGFCYTVDTIDQQIKSSIERGVPIKDILNPSYRLDDKDYGAIQEAGLRQRKTYKLPKLPVELPAKHYKLFVGVAGEPEFKYVFMYDERKAKKQADGSIDYTAAIPDGGWIGYIPSKGTTTLEKLVREAWDKGRLYTKATRPFVCCRFHLKKGKEFWANETEKKIKALEEEIREFL